MLNQRRSYRTVGLPGLIAFLALATPLRADPTIEITSVPPYGVDGFIDGVVTGVDFATHVAAVYIQIEGAGWWTKPSFASPTVPINVNGMFTADVASGGIDNRATIYCAALIPDTVSPPPAAGDSRIPASLASLAVDCKTRFGRTLSFAGFEWAVKEAPVPVGPGGNHFSDLPADVLVDAEGLHLTINFLDGLWWATEVILLESLGHGTYTFRTASELDDLDANATFGAFTWDPYGDEETAGGDAHREIDFEDSRWGDDGDPTTSQMVVQPFSVAGNPPLVPLRGNLERYTLPDLSIDPALTRFFTWMPDQIRFLALSGHHCPLDFPLLSVIHEFVYDEEPASDHYVPTEGRETFRFNLWLNDVASGPDAGMPIEVVITDFTFTPLGATVPVALPGPDRVIDFGQSTLLGELPPVSGGLPPYTYAWSLMPGTGCNLTSDTAANPVLTANRVGTCDPVLTVTDAGRCVSAAAAEIGVVCSSNLELTGEVVDSFREAVSLDTVALEQVTVESTGVLDISARGRVELGNGTVVNSGGTLKVVIDPSADCP